ncbi:MAG: serine/threonine protein phosphatase, partial [Ruminococcaceae bacterium]|nr:serine/threonine protein phosphatase [Oscillospiraceae bacterium]
VFGGAWVGYMEKLKEGVSCITPDDTTVLLGDLSWALSMDAAKMDFAWINEIPGRKIILKGNHDYWWSTASKFYKFCEENGFSQQYILNNNHYEYDGYAICGTRGWFFEEERSAEHDEKVFKRELIRLEASLKSAGDLPKLVFLHYPPVYDEAECKEILDVLKSHGITECYFGHIHGNQAARRAITGVYDGIKMHLISCDYLKFMPVPVK